MKIKDNCLTPVCLECLWLGAVVQVTKYEPFSCMKSPPLCCHNSHIGFANKMKIILLVQKFIENLGSLQNEISALRTEDIDKYPIT